MEKNHERPYAPCLTDDGKAVSILMKQDDPESYLRFTNRSMKQFARILVETLDFDKKNEFEIDWVIEDDYPGQRGFLGYNFKGWGMTEFVPDTMGNGTFGKFIEHVEYIFSKSKEGEKKAVWKHDPDNYHMKKLWGHRIYHNLLNVCKAKVKPSGKEDVFSILKHKVLKEVERQNRGKIGIFGENYSIGDKKEVKACNDPLVLAGLCLIWPYEFFNIEDIHSMKEEDLRNPGLAEHCGGKDCAFEWRETIWDSETIVADEIQRDGFTRGSITKKSCYCGRIRLEAWRTDSNAEIMHIITQEPKDLGNLTDEELLEFEESEEWEGPWVMTCSTDELIPNRDKDKDPIVGVKNKFDYRKYQEEEDYRYDVLSGLLISIFYGKRDYSVEKYITVLDKEGNKVQKRNPVYGKILIKKELPLPETDIRLLADQILLKYKFFEKLGMEPSEKFKDSESMSHRNLREAIENYDFKNLVKGRVYTEESWPRPERMVSEDSYDILKSLEPQIQWGAKDRAAKHRLGRKITEIGQFLQWWDDLSPILNNLFARKGDDEEPLRILKDGIRNVKGVNGD